MRVVEVQQGVYWWFGTCETCGDEYTIDLDAHPALCTRCVPQPDPPAKEAERPSPAQDRVPREQSEGAGGHQPAHPATTRPIPPKGCR